jgi:hypothetical protein
MTNPNFVINFINRFRVIRDLNDDKVSFTDFYKRYNSSNSDFEKIQTIEKFGDRTLDELKNGDRRQSNKKYDYLSTILRKQSNSSQEIERNNRIRVKGDELEELIKKSIAENSNKK